MHWPSPEPSARVRYDNTLRLYDAPLHWSQPLRLGLGLGLGLGVGLGLGL